MPDEPQRQAEPEQGISLDELTEAFAQVMGVQPEKKHETVSSPPGAEPPTGAEAEALDAPFLPAPREPEPAAEQPDACPICPRSILEAMLFVGNRESGPLSARRAAELMRGVEPEEIPTLVDELNDRYAAGGCAYQVVSEGAGYRLTLREAFHPLRKRFYGRIREAKLSQAAVETLAIVAYRQPLTSKQVSRLRGKPSGPVLAQLVRRGLLRIQRQEGARRTSQYFTTDRFLKLFAMESLQDLPHSEELDRQ